MVNTNINWIQMSDAAIVAQIGNFIRNTRMQQNKTQAQLAEMAGLNRWTLSQIENGESITLSSLIQLLRALNSLFVFNYFETLDEISPLEYAKIKKLKQKKRVRNKTSNNKDKDNLGW